MPSDTSQPIIPDIPQGILPSSQVPVTSSQTPISDSKQRLQARNLEEQLKAFALPEPIKHGEQVLSQPRVGDDVHIILTTDSLIPRVRVVSLELFLELALYNICRLAPLDSDMVEYLPADTFLDTLAQLRRDRSHFKATIASVESHVANVCIQSLKNAQKFPTRPFRVHQAQFCRLRLAITLYTSSVITIRIPQGTQKTAKLLRWRHLPNQDAFQLTLVICGEERIEKRVQSVSIYSQNVSEDVKLVSIGEETVLVHSMHESINHDKSYQEREGEEQTRRKDKEQMHTYRSEATVDHIDLTQADGHDSSNQSDRYQMAYTGLKRKRISTHGHQKGAGVTLKPDQTLFDAQQYELMEEEAGDTEPLAAEDTDN